ncbi:hypothetical protein P43SY_011240 [Pythium insidiosum]|uniref:Ty3 transposon capsid-like protein domain-containing protein n=1 Tax=Pythium insidiosum TaxID=114742 RepID=A0AAD5M021_PYTIN|nr:hypothetical protein P43SY_011240 [Pythium insidiosum]
MWKLEALLGRASLYELTAQGEDALKGRIKSFREYENSLLHLIRAQIPDTTPQGDPVSSPATTPQTLKVKVASYQGLESENLTFWFRKLEIAMSAARIHDERLRVTYAMSHLQGRARSWALTWETNAPGHFSSWEGFKVAMLAAFQPPNVAHRQRTQFPSARQDKRELYEFVQELRQLRACMAADPLPEEVMVTVFMNGLALGEARRAVFQSEPRSLEEAMRVAQRADHYDRLARGLPVGRQAGPQDTVGDPEPMDLTLSKEHLNALEARWANAQCHNCGLIEVDLRVKFAHFNSVEHFVLLAMDGRYDLIVAPVRS